MLCRWPGMAKSMVLQAAKGKETDQPQAAGCKGKRNTPAAGSRLQTKGNRLAAGSRPQRKKKQTSCRQQAAKERQTRQLRAVGCKRKETGRLQTAVCEGTGPLQPAAANTRNQQPEAAGCTQMRKRMQSAWSEMTKESSDEMLLPHKKKREPCLGMSTQNSTM
eukprot:TRINITY_DN1626_c1_g1_i12.p1 TRINITY_DN1626_c1_g1~~TRINITY_DN1626_c1_g1_i12.p1  ORF type:complete len:163 (+),score=40.83 TRINITY_DN1626_c1_g1_i12:1888-2376(+)